jgi:hypothetical protein
VVGAVGAVLALAGCAAPYDGDGELALASGGTLLPKSADATHVVVDTDLGGDDLVALAFLVRHPDVVVEAVTIAGEGLVGCDPGVDVVADLFTALGEPAPPVACASSRSTSGGASFPQEWRELAESGTGLPRPASTILVERATAPRLIARLAGRVEGLTVVALGPLTNLAELARTDPASYARLARVHAMGGSVDGPLVDGVAEWNAAADPDAFAAVLAADVPLVVVPEDAIPTGTPELLATAPGVAGVAASVHYEKWWDLVTSAALVSGSSEVESGTWSVDAAGWLTRERSGAVEVVRSLDPRALEEAYGVALSTPH